MRQLGWETEPMELVVRPGSAFFPFMYTEAGHKLTSDQRYEIRFGVGIIWTPTILSEGDHSLLQWNINAASVDTLIGQVTAQKNRNVEFWYVDAANRAAAIWSGKVKVDS